MSNTIRIKRGKSNNLSVSNLQDGELALTLDTNKLYTNKGQISPDNVYVGDTEPTDSNVKCWISPSGKIDLSSLWDQIYPVGSIYITVNATNPSVLFGGTWEQLKGKFLVGIDSSDTDFNTSEKTGGSKTHTNILNDDGYAKINFSAATPNVYQRRISTPTWNETAYTNVGSVIKTDGIGESNYGIGLDGSTGNGSSLPPYLAVYMWKRIL